MSLSQKSLSVVWYHSTTHSQSTLTALGKWPFYMPQTMGIDWASQAYHLSQLANGKAKQTAELDIREASFPRSKHSRSTTQADTPRRKELCSTTRLWCLVDRALHRSAEHATQQHSVAQLHQSQLLQFTVDLWLVSRASSATSLLTADRRPFHYIAVLVNTAGGKPSSRHKN